jgi:phage terminase small subunit
MNLNTRQEAFISEYLVNGFNATRAATTVGYSARTAQEQGARLLSNVIIQKKIQTFREEMEKKTTLTLESLLIRIQKLADSSKKDSDKLKALDMLMKHLGGYTTVNDIIDRMDETELEKLTQKLLAQMKQKAQ